MENIGWFLNLMEVKHLKDVETCWKTKKRPAGTPMANWVN